MGRVRWGILTEAGTMAYDLDLALGQLHRRILGAIGLSPVVVGLSLAGCATESEIARPDRGSSDPAIDEPSLADVEPSAGTTATVGQGSTGTIAPPVAGTVVQPEAPVVCSSFVASHGALNPGHVVEVQVADAPPGGSVALYLGQAVS